MPKGKVKKEKAIQLELPLRAGLFAENPCQKCGKVIVADWSLMPAFAVFDISKFCTCNGS